MTPEQHFAKAFEDMFPGYKAIVSSNGDEETNTVILMPADLASPGYNEGADRCVVYINQWAYRDSTFIRLTQHAQFPGEVELPEEVFAAIDADLQGDA